MTTVVTPKEVENEKPTPSARPDPILKENPSQRSLVQKLSRVTSSISQFIQESVTHMKEAVRQLVIINDDGCEPKHCRIIVLTSISFLAACSIWTIYMWLDDIAGIHCTGRRIWPNYFKPSIPFIGSQLSVAFACFQPLLSSVWLSWVVNSRNNTSLYWYLKLTMWLTIHPCVVIFYFILYYGKITTAQTEIMLRTQMKIFNPNSPQEVEEWRIIHREYKCCGIRNWRDWVTETGSQFTDEKVPRSCCVNEQAEKDTNSDCPWYPNDKNTFLDGCLWYLFKSQSLWTGSILLALISSFIFTHASVLTATCYYERCKRQIHKDFKYTWCNMYQRCLCPFMRDPSYKMDVMNNADNAESKIMETFRTSRVHPRLSIQDVESMPAVS